MVFNHKLNDFLLWVERFQIIQAHRLGQPDDSQIEVAIASLKAVLPEYADEAKNEDAEIEETPEENNLQEKTNDW